MDYEEIQELSRFTRKHRIDVKVILDSYLAGNTSFPMVGVKFQDYSFRIFVDDEYDDLKINSKLLAVCIVLRALESYDFAEDYLIWCTQHGFDAAIPEVRNHFQQLGEVVKWFKYNNIPIYSFIADYDFELNAGAAQFLRYNPDF